MNAAGDWNTKTIEAIVRRNIEVDLGSRRNF